MRSSYTQLYVHCVWSTWNRLPLLTPDIREIVYGAIAKECQTLKCTPIAIGGIDDHVHLLAGYLPTISVSALMKQVKGSSSHLMNYQIRPDQFFKWQSSYSAFSVSQSGLDVVAAYIRNQEQHHTARSLQKCWELPDKAMSLM
ncbi:MAG: IS200/IS605 family transposase [Elainellaceae cyanobacterium]